MIKELVEWELLLFVNVSVMRSRKLSVIVSVVKNNYRASLLTITKIYGD